MLKVPTYFPCAVLLLVAGCAVGWSQLIAPSSIFSARVEHVDAIIEKASVHVIIKNVGQLPITAFSLGFSRLNAAGQRVPCGGRGVDMADWSDPMPRRNIYIHMRRKWIAAGGTATLDGYPRCPDGAASLDQVQVELRMIMFDNGTGEGDAARMEDVLRLRQEILSERLKWLPRFTALRTTADLRSATLRLYQDLVDATRAADIDPDRAAAEAPSSGVRDELQGLALELTQWARNGEPLAKNELLQWRITDLEDRTARLARGSGMSVAGVR